MLLIHKERIISARWSLLIGLMLLWHSGCAWQRLPLSPVDSQAVADSIQRDLSLARLAERQGNPGRARRLYHDIIHRDSSNAVAYHRLGVMAAKAGRLSEALEQLQQAQEFDPTTSEIPADIGYVHYLSGELDRAEQSLRSALEINADDARALNNLGLVYGMQGSFHDSAEAFRRAGTQAEAHANLAYVMTQRGETELAVEQYHKALEIDGKLSLAAIALVQLDKHAPRRQEAIISQKASIADYEADASRYDQIASEYAAKARAFREQLKNSSQIVTVSETDSQQVRGQALRLVGHSSPPSDDDSIRYSCRRLTASRIPAEMPDKLTTLPLMDSSSTAFEPNLIPSKTVKADSPGDSFSKPICVESH